MTINRVFRDYATRVSFNLSLSRNQVGHLAGIVTELENERLHGKLEFNERADRRTDAVIEGGGNPSLFIVGRGSLVRMGLVEHDPRWVKANESEENGAIWKYNGPSYRLTAAGEHIVELLRIAGLIPQRAVNDQVKRAKARRRA